MIPWEAMAVNMENKIRPCCRFKVKHSVAPKDYEEAFKQLRIDMLNGKKDPRCKKCWQEEAAGGPGEGGEESQAAAAGQGWAAG